MLTTTAGVTLSEARRIRDLHFSQFREMTKRMFSVGCGQYPYKSFVVDCDAMPAQRGNGAFEVDSVPKDDGSDNEVEATRPVALVLETAVTQVTLPVEEDGARSEDMLTLSLKDTGRLLQ
jgi:hypothetical protein